jgi:hypothetical protein
MAKKAKKKSHLNEEKLELLGLLLDQLNGVLICTLAACEDAPGVPRAIQSALFAAAKLSDEAQHVI